ncbi:hypothetical protein M9H77_17963 [Catharanthus roseus]|uniref:Uncharacterized protein n=1 Tax=Catharanthus roseus TaxID=4058 RepID=A0ACC0B634_CATRO|nr:hypothetical protein M9H77_17963 [Catharanthus roseus]
MPNKKVAEVVDEWRSSSSSSKRAPKGHFVVYVGNEMTRFVVPMSYLKHPLFQQLLDKAAEEYGFDNNTSRILLPCDQFNFQQLLIFISSHH